ncbi:MAG: UDP-N-acetylmuramoyl-L-alanyl-D-glutamate--2,6-diaminopimelate ligase [Candidatus Peregrinibacteria bacterium Greene0416_62]|nr:MAG: UDP-N-acetylmuramoyl-L-alanyl-D-glutamate--2,6-diaminopimelate ligase [Candidatus Peregrinibacteria bacterium Greene0416_62]
MIGRLKACIGQRNPLRLAYHAGKSLIAALCYGFPARRITVISVTGTDGKTTTTSMIAHILRASGLKVGIASTAFFDDGTGLKENPSHLTSISPFVLQKLLRQMLNNKCTHAVLECSSHGLVQHRLDWTFPRVAAITNTALEHLDYHGTMEQYRKDKGILFRMLKGKGTKILNICDETYSTYSGIPSDKTIVWSPTQQTHETTLWLSDIHSTATSTEATVHFAQSQIAHSTSSGQANRKSQIVTVPTTSKMRSARSAPLSHSESTFNNRSMLCAHSPVSLAVSNRLMKDNRSLFSWISRFHRNPMKKRWRRCGASSENPDVSLSCVPAVATACGKKGLRSAASARSLQTW